MPITLRVTVSARSPRTIRSSFTWPWASCARSAAPVGRADRHRGDVGRRPLAPAHRAGLDEVRGRGRHVDHAHAARGHDVLHLDRAVIRAAVGDHHDPAVGRRCRRGPAASRTARRPPRRRERARCRSRRRTAASRDRLARRDDRHAGPPRTPDRHVEVLGVGLAARPPGRPTGCGRPRRARPPSQGAWPERRAADHLVRGRPGVRDRGRDRRDGEEQGGADGDATREHPATVAALLRSQA